MELMKGIKVLVGVLLMILGLMSYSWWWPSLLVVIKGLLGIFVAGIGLLVLLIGVSD